MLKKVVQVSFLLIGGTLGVLFLPHLFTLFSFTSTHGLIIRMCLQFLEQCCFFAQPFPYRTNC